MNRYINTLLCSLIYCMAAMALTGCVEEELLQDGITSSGTFSLTVTQEQKDQTKLAFGDDFLTTYWEDGDVLSLRRVSDNLGYDLTTSLEKPSTEAVFTYPSSLAGGEYYVYYYNANTFGGEIFWDNNAVQERGPYKVGSAGDKTPLYGKITIKAGQRTAEVKLKPVYSMLRFTIKNDGRLPHSGFTKRVGMLAPQSGFAQKVTLQADGTLTETMNRQPKWEIDTDYGDISKMADERALILPVDLSGQDVYFYVSYFNGASTGCEEYVFEFKKQGKDLKAGVCYNITLDLKDATMYDLSDRKLDCPGDFRALAYRSNLYTYNDGGSVTVPYKVTQDVDFTGQEFFPIMGGLDLVIDGNDKTLSNISVDWPFDGAGLIGSGSPRISKLIIDNATIKGKDYVGAFCGSAASSTSIISQCELKNSTIEGVNYVGGLHGGPLHGGKCNITDCSVENSSIKATSSFVGGIAGQIRSLSGSEVDAKTKVNGVSYVGGIAGAANSKVSDCSSSATVVANGECAGGILGATQSMDVMYTSQGSAERCANEGSVTGNNNVGGIVGYAYGNVAIDQCYSAGTVSGGNNIGGIAGYADQPITYCYNIGNIEGTGYVGGIVGECIPSAASQLLQYCYSAGTVSSGKGIIGGFPESPYKHEAFIGCVTTSPEIGDSRQSDDINKNREHTNLTDINSKISIIDPNSSVYFPDRVWDLSINPNKCTIFLWQGDGFGVEVGTGN